MDGERIAGLLTSWDIVNKVAGPAEDLIAVTCGQLMSSDPLVLHEDDTIAIALNAMASGGYGHVPVSHDDKLIGILVPADVFRQISPHLV
jgi:CBS domain-containing protein